MIFAVEIRNVWRPQFFGLRALVLVPNRYQVSPSRIMEGSCTNSVSPLTAISSPAVAAWAGADEDNQTTRHESTIALCLTFEAMCVSSLREKCLRSRVSAHRIE